MSDMLVLRSVENGSMFLCKCIPMDSIIEMTWTKDNLIIYRKYGVPKYDINVKLYDIEIIRHGDFFMHFNQNKGKIV